MKTPDLVINEAGIKQTATIPTGILARQAKDGTPRYRGTGYRNGKQRFGPWVPRLEDAIRDRKEILDGRTKPYSRAPRERRVPIVYFVQMGKDGPVKIGYTDRPLSQRLAGLQSANPYELWVIGWCRAPRSFEKALHERFARFRIRGEWFEPHAEILDLADEVPEEVLERSQVEMETIDFEDAIRRLNHGFSR